MEKKIQVEITASQKVTYKQIINVSEEDWLVLQDLEMDDISDSDPETSEHYKLLEKYIDFRDVFYAESEFENVTAKERK